MQRDAAAVRVPEVLGTDPQPRPGSLDECLMRRAVAAEDYRQTGHALAADEADLDAGFAASFRDHGGKAGLDEIDVVDSSFARLEHLLHWKVEGFQVWLQQVEVLARKARKDAICGPICGGISRHRSSPEGQEHQPSLKRPRPKT